MTTTTTNGRPPFAEYVKAGLSAFPVRADGSKAPAVAWSEYRSRLATSEEAESWASRFRGIGIAAGKISGNLEILDIDAPALVRPFVDAVKGEAPGLIDKLCMVRTPRRDKDGKGGCHLLYRCESEVGTTKLAMTEPLPEFNADGEPVINPATGKQVLKPKTLLETKGEGGYVLAPGCSPECHETGNLYEHVHGPALTAISTITAGERDLLHRIARTFDRSIASTHRDNGRERVENRSPGDDYASQVSWEDILTPHGWRPVRTVGDTTQWCRPGKETGISATTGLKSGSGNELLVVFSTNAAPFDGINQAGRPGATYTKFAAYSLLNHAGDYSEAARALARLGFGDKRDGDAEYERETGDQAGEPRDIDDTAAPEDRPKATRFVFSRLSAAELDAATFETEYLIDRTLVAGQPMVLAGAKKTLKTSILIDMGISLSVGGFFLGKLRVSRACRVGILSGESGMSTIQETARRIAHTAGYSLGDLGNLVFSDSLPRFENAAHIEALKQFILDDALEVVVLDPAYLCMRGTDAGNLFLQGEQLRNVNQVCTDTGCTMILAHHTAKRRGAHLEVFDPPELEDIAWSGFQEWARQWALVGRREKYEPGTGEHRLWMHVGGSAGHSALWALDIAEGLPPDRFWDVTVKHADEAREDAQERRETVKADAEAKRAEKRLETDRERIVRALAKHPEGLTERLLRPASRVYDRRFKEAIATLIEDGDVVPCEIKRDCRKTPYEGWKLRETDAP